MTLRDRLNNNEHIDCVWYRDELFDLNELTSYHYNLECSEPNVYGVAEIYEGAEL